MQIKINDNLYTFPSSLADYTLGQRIKFQQEHGDTLDAMLKSILAMKAGIEKEMELAEFHFEKCFRTFSFFTGIDVEVLKESEFIEDITAIYYANLKTLNEDEESAELQTSYVWNGETWHLQPPELKQGSKLKFGQFIDSKQRVKDLIALGRNKWETLIPLCAVYLQREGEGYKKEFLYEDSERLKLMESLPMNIALAVGFFLTASLNISLNTLRSSKAPKAKGKKTAM